MADNTIIRVTKAQKLEVIKRFIPEDATYTFPGNETKAPYIFDHSEIIAFIDTEIAQLAKKNTGNTGKQTEIQKKNQVIKDAICEYLAELPEDSDGATCAEIARNVLSIHCPKESTPQKATGMFKQLKGDGKVGSKSVKGKVYFFLL